MMKTLREVYPSYHGHAVSSWYIVFLHNVLDRNKRLDYFTAMFGILNDIFV